MIQFDSLLKENLSLFGYPQNSIIIEGNLGEKSFPDYVIIDEDSGIILAIIEAKSYTPSNYYNTEKMAFRDLKKYYEEIKSPTKAIAALYNKEEASIEFVDFTEAIKDNDFSRRENHYTLPLYSDLVNGAGHKSIKQKEIKQNGNIRILKRLCWIVFPIVSTILLILDFLEKYVLTSERLIAIGALFISLLLPCFKTIKIGEISLEREIEKQNKEHK